MESTGKGMTEIKEKFTVSLPTKASSGTCCLFYILPVIFFAEQWVDFA